MASARLADLAPATSSDIASLPSSRRSLLLARIGELAQSSPDARARGAERRGICRFRDGSGG